MQTYDTVPGTRYPTMQAAQGMDINAILGTFVDRGIWPYYDRLYVSLPASPGTQGTLSGTYNPFSIPVNGTDQVTGLAKNKVQTNMIAANSFGATRCMIVESLGFIFPSFLNKTNIDVILENCYMTFVIAEKIFYEGLLTLWPGGAGLMGVSTQTGEESYTLGLPVPAAMRRFGAKFSKYIAPLINFSMTITFQQSVTLNFTVPSGQTTVPGALTNPSSSLQCVPWLVPMLDGVTDRPVQ